MSVVQIGKESLPDDVMLGSGTVGTDETPLTDVGFPVKKHIVVRADSGNTGTVKVGRTGHAATGFILNAGEQTPPIYIDNTEKLAVVASDTDQAYSWIAN